MSAAYQPPHVLTDSELHEVHMFGDGLGAKGNDAVLAEDLAAIDCYAPAFAARVHGPEFDPGAHHHDRLREERYNADRHDLERTFRPAADLAGARVLNLEHELASRNKGLSKPELDEWIAPTAIVVLLLTIAPTFHDQFFITLGDEILAWLASLVSAAFVGGFVVWSLLGSTEVTSGRGALTWVGLLGGVGIGVGLGILRAAYATTISEYVFAAALTLTEISAVVAVEFVASHMREKFHAWHEQEEALSPVRAELELARHAKAQCDAKRDEAERRCDAHVSHVEMRHARHHQTQDITLAVKGAAERAYRDRVASNWTIRHGTPQSQLRRVG